MKHIFIFLMFMSLKANATNPCEDNSALVEKSDSVIKNYLSTYLPTVKNYYTASSTFEGESPSRHIPFSFDENGERMHGTVLINIDQCTFKVGALKASLEKTHRVSMLTTEKSQNCEFTDSPEHIKSYIVENLSWLAPGTSEFYLGQVSFGNDEGLIFFSADSNQGRMHGTITVHDHCLNMLGSAPAEMKSIN